MADVYCPSRGGDGMVRILYGDHERKTLRWLLISCRRCEPHEEDFSTRRNNEEAVPSSDISSLQNQGYLLIV
jgi:hypothetical protein